MIKVLSKGKRYQIECEVCNSMLEYGIEDIITDAYDKLSFEEGRFTNERVITNYLKCPVCGHYISEKQLEPFQIDELLGK